MNSKVTLVIATDIIVNGRFARIEELHRSDCADLLKKKNSKDYRFASFIESDSIEASRAEYDEDMEELGYYFDDEVKVLPCAHK
jgi:hypothetical protein